MKKILVTGASGFVGKYLIEELLKDSSFEIFGTYKNNLPPLDKRVKLNQLDLENSEELQKLISEIKPEVIYHLAAQTSPRDSFKNPWQTIKNNVSSQINLFESLKKENLTDSRIIIVSSAEVYGIVSPENLPIDEETPFNPSNPYAVSKVTQDLLALEYFNSEKLNVVRIRPFNHTGPGQSDNFVIPSFAKKIAMVEKGKLEKITVGNLKAKRDFTDVSDMVKAYVLAAEKGESGEVYNIGSGVSYEISQILEKLVSMSRAKIEITTDPSLMMPIDNPELVCDYSKFKSVTGWTPQINIDQTLRETLDYWREVI